MGWLTVLLAMEMVATVELEMQAATEVAINLLLLENMLIILFLKIMVLHIPHIDRIVGKFSIQYNLLF